MSEEGTIEVRDEPIVTARQQETWTLADRKILGRFIKLAEERNIQVFLRCADTGCKGDYLKREEVAGGFDLLCTHKRRTFRVGV